MLWPDVAIALSTGVLGVFLLPMVWNRATYVPRLTSGAYTVAVAGVAVGLLTSGLLLGAAINMADAAGWAVIFAMRGTRDKRRNGNAVRQQGDERQV